ncbi:MAG: carboxylating nicotinate-nucleotide diphosphorylase, partial [Candidatus Omnitrophica bacterium]|nr:carboxylating nicotinate-nucleotide diphosphorylase [Candidatus Omnitrophota bacterium]
MKPQIRSLIRQALREDIGSGDLTTKALVPPDLSGTAYIQAKSNGILCGGEVVKEVFRLIDSRLKVAQTVSDGGCVSKGKKVFILKGRLSSILKGERVALNFLGHLSGIATLTYQFAAKIKGTRAKIYDTRKTTPLWRELEKYAVRTGGGVNHRFGLWDEILVKDNHWAAIRPLLEKTRCRYFGERLESALARKKVPVEIEVASLRELSHLLEGKFRPDRILLDNFSVRDIKHAVKFVKKMRRGI